MVESIKIPTFQSDTFQNDAFLIYYILIQTYGPHVSGGGAGAGGGWGAEAPRFMTATSTLTRDLMPADWPGTFPEYLVWRELTRMKIEFEYQASELGGRQERGGAILDFFIPSLGLGINVNSTYWHYGRPNARQLDRLQREQLEASGIRMVYVDEEDLLRNAHYYVSEALAGHDYSLASQGVI